MLTLKSIRIRNFRAIKELTFTPKTEGITGIFGPNGAGKTSILTAVMFALYGVRPKGINVAALRRIGSDVEECSVSVVFTHLGQTIEAIRELKGTNNRVIVNIYVDGQPESVTSVGAADRWMTKRLGIDADGFLTAFVVRQKELDSFVRADPAERKRIIEKLAGVETINNALKAAREDEKDSRKTVDILPGSSDQVDASANDVDYYSNEADQAESELSTTKVALDALNIERTGLFDKIQQLRDKASIVERLTLQISQLNNEIIDLESQLNRVAYVKDIEAGQDVVSLRAKYGEITAEVNALRSQQAAATHQLEQATQRKTQLEAQKHQTENLRNTVASSVVRTLESINQDQNDTSNQQHENNSEIKQLKIQVAELKESIKMLEGTADCPTCKTHLKNPEALVKQFKNLIVTHNETLQEHNQEIARLSVRAGELNTEMEAAIYLSQLEDSITKFVGEIEEVEELLSNSPNPNDLTEQIQTLSEAQQKVVELGSKAKSLNEDRVLHENLVNRREVALQELAENKISLEDETSVFNPKDLPQAQSKLDTVNTDFTRLTGSQNSLTARMTEANVRLQTARTTHTRAYEQWEKKKKLQEAHASKTLTTDMLEKFRQEVVSSIAPELSDHATELISAMTNGDFTEIKLDDEFKASLVDSQGIERPVAWLSGGEESAVALALRLGVASLITGGTPELLWLDEPMTAQDKDRRSAILSMIRSLPTNQILLINHAQEAQDIVDYEITLTKD